MPDMKSPVLSVMTASPQQRICSRSDDGYADRLLAVLRQQFGGHDVRRTDGDG